MAKLSEKAMLIRHRVRYWDARKYDKSISDEVADAKGAERDAGRYNKALIARDALKEIRQIRHAAKAHHERMTLPWDRSIQILPADAYMQYMAKQQEFRIQYENAVDEFIRNYPDFIEDAKKRLNGMFDERDYPSAGELQFRFGIKLHVLPMPDAQDFRVALSDKETAQIRETIEEQVNERIGNAMQDLWKRVYDAVEHMRDVLADKDKRITESLVGNLREIVDLLPVLNITGDPELARMAKRITQSLYKRDAVMLRENDKAREQQAQTADEILAAMAGYIGGSK